MKWDLNGAGVISDFRKKNSFLSNFFEKPFIWKDRMFMSAEGAFQSEKSTDPAVQEKFTRMTPKEAKEAGRRLALRPDWESVKDEIMEEIIYEKFSQNDSILYKLIETGNATLIEGNTWHDTYWGVDAFSGEGENKLGIILMKVRARLIDELGDAESIAEAMAEAAVS